MQANHRPSVSATMASEVLCLIVSRAGLNNYATNNEHRGIRANSCFIASRAKAVS